MNFYNVLLFLGDNITSSWEDYVKRYCNGFQIPAKGEKEKWTNIFCKKYGIANKWSMTYKQEEDCKQFIKDNAKMLWITDGSSNLDELKEKVSHIYLRRVKEDIPGIVNKTVHELFYDLTPKQTYEYSRLWDEYEKQRLETNPDDELNKDLIEGGIYRRYLSNEMVPHTIKLVEELLEDGRKVVIGCCYDEELYTLQEHFKDKCVIYNGKMTAKQKDAAKDKFMEDKKVSVMICNIMAAGVGLSLTASNALVFNTMDYVPASNMQFEDRVHRLSSKENVDIYYQIFSNTEYERVWNIVLRKSLVIGQVIKKEDEK
jgi:SWI/SNF-related matrix-associated actin-dependent regulator 1 of chromatin subfamily A